MFDRDKATLGNVLFHLSSAFAFGLPPLLGLIGAPDAEAPHRRKIKEAEDAARGELPRKVAPRAERKGQLAAYNAHHDQFEDSWREKAMGTAPALGTFGAAAGAAQQAGRRQVLDSAQRVVAPLKRLMTPYADDHPTVQSVFGLPAHVEVKEVDEGVGEDEGWRPKRARYMGEAQERWRRSGEPGGRFLASSLGRAGNWVGYANAALPVVSRLAHSVAPVIAPVAAFPSAAVAATAAHGAAAGVEWARMRPDGPQTRTPARDPQDLFNRVYPPGHSSQELFQFGRAKGEEAPRPTGPRRSPVPRRSPDPLRWRRPA